MKPGGHDAGFTLLELAAVLAIYSLIAVVSIQVLSGALRNQGRAQRVTHDVTESVAILTVLRRDLEEMAPAGMLPDGSGSFAADATGHLTLLREARSGSDTGLERVEWGIDRAAGTLWRRASIPGSDAARPPVTMLSGLEGWSIRTLSSEGAWVPAQNWIANEIAGLPRAVEVRLRTAALGDLRLVAAR